MEKIEGIIKEIAVKHRIAIGRDDPILILHTLNERLLKETSDAQRQVVHEFREELESAYHSWETNAKSISEKILNSSLIGVRETMKKIVADEGTTAGQLLSREVESSLNQVRSTLKVTQIATIINGLAAVMTCLALVAILWKII
jgi:hypothetical protein